MLAEVKKINGHYMIPGLDKLSLKKDIFFLEIPDYLIKKEEMEKSKAYKNFEELKIELKGDPLIDILFKHMPLDYKEEVNEETDRDIWYEAIREKYEL